MKFIEIVKNDQMRFYILLNRMLYTYMDIDDYEQIDYFCNWMRNLFK